MFDIGFWELALLAVIGLIVLGPERLPNVARTLGLWAGRARMYVRNLTSELEREVNTADLRRDLASMRDEVEQGGRRLEAEARGDNGADEAASKAGEAESGEHRAGGADPADDTGDERR